MTLCMQATEFCTAGVRRPRPEEGFCGGLLDRSSTELIQAQDGNRLTVILAHVARLVNCSSFGILEDVLDRVGTVVGKMKGEV